MIRFFVLALAAVILTGCLSIETPIKRVDANGTVWEYHPKMTAWGGARAALLSQRFEGKMKLPDGAEVEISHGAGMENAETPDTFGTGLQYLKTLFPQGAYLPETPDERMQKRQLDFEGEQLTAEELEALKAFIDRQQVVRD